jgi:hypothetical protein
MSLQKQIELLKRQLNDLQTFVMYDLPVVMQMEQKRRRKK